MSFVDGMLCDELDQTTVSYNGQFLIKENICVAVDVFVRIN